ncbi:MAG: elongation factor P [Candidatus Dasytiphilus stammeri]
MMIYHPNDFYSGLKIIWDGEPYSIESSEFVKPGKGQSFVRVKMRRLLTGQLIEKTFKTTDTAEKADVLDLNMIYLYKDGTFWYFMNNNTFEQIAADIKAVGDTIRWLSNHIDYTVTLWNGKPIGVTPPNFVELTITSTTPSLRGDSIGSGAKLATLSTGAVIKVPYFFQEGEIVKVNTRSGEYVARVK